MGFEDEAEQSFGRPCRQSQRQVQADIRTHLIHRPARDVLEVPQRQRTAGTFRRLAKLMAGAMVRIGMMSKRKLSGDVSLAFEGTYWGSSLKQI